MSSKTGHRPDPLSDVPSLGMRTNLLGTAYPEPGYYRYLKPLDDVKPCLCLDWDRIRCSVDKSQSTPEGMSPDIGRFPWLGVIQHSFYIGGAVRFAVTAGVLVHPAYAIAPAEDIAKILPETIMNNTKFILWYSDSLKYSIDVKDYVLHPDYQKVTQATIAVLELNTHGETGLSDNSQPVLPVCMPVRGAGTFSDLYAVKMTDESGELQKEIRQMSFVNSQDCAEFYYKANLSYKMMAPTNPICAASLMQTDSCIWDGGVALISRQSWGYWKLLGFGVRGPGCGAPARFINIHDYLFWIDEVVSNLSPDDMTDMHKIYFRRLSPYKLMMYKGDTIIPTEHGYCERGKRGGVLYKDTSEIVMTKNFGQGFYFVAVSQIAGFLCAIVNVETTARSNAAVWVEHHCHRDVSGLMHGMNEGPDYRRIQCFLYFKSTAFIEFRFYFSFRATIELTLYGKEERPRKIPNPFHRTETTDEWEPTNRIIRWANFVPYYKWWYWM
ncbi:uncharacterized protein LOC113517758 [Galleria mellonella]|uniref:Uncharacterized protein LOC113517758 n=1 Tax=Galleria mellonella TaxID=7137 RepID=A0ABM3MI44_GALME|nr:uncharacterized protein LOC113517758 [Galleria mellonella]